ncbi:MAG: 30S ribosomal protein S6 [Candidatus Berkelbacteria bacterium]|nr:30S ribosomal protein S6 [Candidatus Berkelbacteria bacterium]
MKTYEITFITKEDLKEKPVKEDLEKLGGKILSISGIGEKNFTYPIKKEAKGFYTTISFEIDPVKLIDLNKKLSLHDDILRHLIIIGKTAQVEIPKLPKPEKEIEAPKKEKKEIKDIEDVKEIKEVPKPVKKETVKPLDLVPQGARGKEKPKVSAKVTEIEKDTETEEDRLKALDKKLDELLKE